MGELQRYVVIEGNPTCAQSRGDTTVALLVDPAIWPWRGMLFCHLVSDTSLDELHAFARWIGVPERAYGGDHYDISERMRLIAIDEGALEVSSRDIVRALYNAGLRRPPVGRIRQSRPVKFVPFAEENSAASVVGWG
jgi:hypothetical protein